MDKYAHVRTLLFPAVAGALDIDLSLFKLRKDGHEHYGPCPVHRPKNNKTSFSYENSGKFHCFSCEAKGRGPIDLAIAVKRIGFKDAVALLEPLVGSKPIPDPAKEKSPALDDSRASVIVIPSATDCKPLAKDTWRKFAVPCPWLEQRIPDAAVRERFGVFAYSNPKRKSAYSGRVMIPIRELDGTLMGYLGRHIADNSSSPQTSDDSIPKYLFPKNLPKSRFLFGSHELRQCHGPERLRIVYLVESPFCVMKFAMCGLPAVSPFGWSVSDEQAECLKPIGKGIVYLPDRNKYEDRHVVLGLLAKTFWCRCPPLPAGIEDPEQMTKEQVLAL